MTQAQYCVLITRALADLYFERYVRIQLTHSTAYPYIIHTIFHCIYTIFTYSSIMEPDVLKDVNPDLTPKRKECVAVII